MTGPIGRRSARVAACLLLASLAPCCADPAPIIHYAPTENLEHIDVALIDRAKHEIDMAAYVLTDWPVMQALTRAADRGVSAHASLRERKPAPLPVIVASVFKRSRVERASRSRRVAISTSPLASWSRARRNWTRSVFAPLAVSRKTFSAPAARNCFTCASTLWPSVDTLA